MKKRILHLTLKKKWFDLIAQGKKKEEYREEKRYWLKRLYNKSLFKREFDEVHFTNGYGKNKPFMRVEWKGIYQANVDFEDKIRDMFVIKLGKILEIKNWKGRKAHLSQIMCGIAIGLTLSILLQHFIYGKTDIDYNILFQLNRIFIIK